MPMLLRTRRFRAAAGSDLTGFLLAIRRAAIVAILLLGYLYYRLAGEAYALVGIGLISFAAVAQFAPAMLGGMYWKGGTRAGALAGLGAGFAVWVYTLLLPSFAKSGWLGQDFLAHGAFGLELLRPEALFGLKGLDYLTHSLFWSLLANAGLYVTVSLWRAPSARETSQALLFVDVFRRTAAAGPVFWRGRAQVADLLPLLGRFLGLDRAQALFDDYARRQGVAAPRCAATRCPAGAVRRDAAGRRHRQRLGAGDGGLGGGGGIAGPGRRDAHPRRGLAAARLFAPAGAGDRRAEARQRAAEEPGPAEGRLHVLGDARAAHAADLDPRAGRGDARRCRDAGRAAAGVPGHRRGRDRAPEPAGQPGAGHGQDRVRPCRMAQQPTSTCARC